ncbi:MAG: hypothetical protein H6811_01750 [Phycisphaeraceae bacterium]|nr:hypothetical protein [Phycisphaeraceae bacterium]
MLLGKTVYVGLDDQGDEESITTYAYNARGRMTMAEIDQDADLSADVTTEYLYDDDGLRIRQETDDGQDQTTRDSLWDKQNATGYAQVVEETLDDGGGPEVERQYTVGLDVIAQAVATAISSLAAEEPAVFLYDEHGSVRQLADRLGAAVTAAYNNVAQQYALEKIDYEAYGESVNAAIETAITALLYSGEFTDSTVGMQYLRARWYNESTGRFVSLDSYAGSVQVPTTLQQFLYGLSDPIRHTDPSGNLPPLVLGILGYISSVIANYLIGKTVEATVNLALTGSVTGVAWFSKWDILSLVPGSAITAGGRAVVHASLSAAQATAKLLHAIAGVAHPVGRAAQYAGPVATWFTRTFVTASDNAWVLTTKTGQTVRMSEKGFRHVIEHVPAYVPRALYNPARHSLWPALTTPDDVARYFEEFVSSIDYVIQSGKLVTAELSNGIKVGAYFNYKGKVHTFFPISGDGVVMLQEAANAML